MASEIGYSPEVYLFIIWLLIIYEILTTRNKVMLLICMIINAYISTTLFLDYALFTGESIFAIVGYSFSAIALIKLLSTLDTRGIGRW